MLFLLQLYCVGADWRLLQRNHALARGNLDPAQLMYSTQDECERGTAKLEAIMTGGCKNGGTYTNDVVPCSCEPGYSSNDNCATSTTTTTTTTSTAATTTTTTKKPSCYPRLTFEQPSTLPSSPPTWDATNAAALGWPSLLSVNQQVVLKVPDVSVLATIGRQSYTYKCLAEHPRLEQANPAPVTASDLTYQLMWTKGVVAPDGTVRTSTTFADSSDFVGQSPPPGLVQTGEEGAPTHLSSFTLRYEHFRIFTS